MTTGTAQKIIPLLPGLGLAVVIAIGSSLLAYDHQALDPLVLSMLISIILGNLIGTRVVFQPGISFSGRVIIPIGIVLYGSQVNLSPLRQYGMDTILQVIVMVGLGIAAIVWLSRTMSIGRKTGLLLAAGSSICGASAIIVLSPVIRAGREDTSVSLLAITVVGLTGVILYPLLQETLAVPEDTYALLCGSTLSQMGQVRAAASLLGDSALNLAVPVKLLRVSMLLPVAVLYSLLSRHERGGSIYIPWFVVGFIIMAAMVNVFPSLAAHRATVSASVSFFFAIAIAGIGLSVDLESIIDAGLKPLLAAFIGWLFLILFFLAGAVLLP